MAAFPIRHPSRSIVKVQGPLPSTPPYRRLGISAARISVKPTIETLKRLERSYEQTVDPRPRKKARTPPGEDEVSLGWSDDEMDVVSPASVAGPSGLGGRYETNLVLSNETNDSTAPEDKYIVLQ